MTDIDPAVAKALCEFTSLTEEQKKEFLMHAGDTFCLTCGKQTDGRTCHIFTQKTVKSNHDYENDPGCKD